MGKFWSLLFLMVPILGVATFVVASTIPDHWLPLDISQHGKAIDNLFYFILYLTGVVFVVTGFVLVYFMWKYSAERNTEPVKYSHGSHNLEVIWSILPAVTLLFIAIYQMDTWAANRMRRPMLPGADGKLGTEDDVPKPPLAKVTGRQFEWRIQYAGPDGKLETPDDLHVVNDLHVPIDEEIVLQIESQDVLHSFFLPNVRLKQDVIPGMKQFVWFKPLKSGTYDIVCAELCGWGHYKMKGRLSVESREQFDRWFTKTMADQKVTSLPGQPAAEGASP